MTARRGKRKRRMRIRRIWIIAAAALLFIAGVGVILYPHLVQWGYEGKADQGYERFIQQIEAAEAATAEADARPGENKSAQDAVDKPVPFPELLKEMQAYNEKIFAEGQAHLSSPQAYERPSFTLADYGVADNIIGYIEIPAIDVLLPIYLGANNANMKLGATHLSQTSLPIGGENTNSVICGHKGYSKAVLFDRLMELREGDEVIIRNLWSTLTYHVASTTTIMDDEADKLTIQPGRDMVTLFTCYYQQGRKDRYVVYCERYEAQGD